MGILKYILVDANGFLTRNVEIVLIFVLRRFLEGFMFNSEKGGGELSSSQWFNFFEIGICFIFQPIICSSR
jgi:hypothetical protein